MSIQRLLDNTKPVILTRRRQFHMSKSPLGINLKPLKIYVEKMSTVLRWVLFG